MYLSYLISVNTSRSERKVYGDYVDENSDQPLFQDITIRGPSDQLIETTKSAWVPRVTLNTTDNFSPYDNIIV